MADSPDKELVIVCPRAEVGSLFPCRKCGQGCDLGDEARIALAMGASPLCYPCAMDIAHNHPGAFERFGR